MEEGEQGKFSTGEGKREEVPVVTDSLEWWETQIRACVQKKTQAQDQRVCFVLHVSYQGSLIIEDKTLGKQQCPKIVHQNCCYLLKSIPFLVLNFHSLLDG